MFMMQPVKTLTKTEHFPYDVCNCRSCLEDADRVEYDEDIPKKKKGSQRSLKKRYEAGDPSVGLLGEPSGKFDYYVLYEYQAEFPALTTFENPQQKTKHNWKIRSYNVVGHIGSPNQTTAAEATLNWQSENDVAKNNILKTILAQQNRCDDGHILMISHHQNGAKEALKCYHGVLLNSNTITLTWSLKAVMYAWHRMNPGSSYHRLNFSEDWVSTREALAKENGVCIDDIPPEVFFDNEIWPEDDPRIEEWGEAINDYYNDRFTRGSLYDEIFMVDTKEIRIFKDTSEDDSLDQDPQKFTVEMPNIPAKSCLEEADRVEYDEDIPKKKKGSQRCLKKRYEAGDPSVGLLGEPSGKFDYYVLYEATLNWQSENAVAKNNILKTILAQQNRFNQTQEALVDRVHSLENIIYEVR
ncbi:hypothetical protein L1987_38343 [Smallanthus sonchifolius]|uniref:Uncharacterized protein n=1 Tax=Smallanthus sonchifolius TaxID=185202 RepID=A0ACB9HKA5_9ASTR|nr:hypothetical protein L1987_38343 [Smallanthus sonchifolius]